jgi:integrase
MRLLKPKSEKSRRSIDLPAVTLAALREHSIRQGEAKEWAATGWRGNEWDLVFTSPRGRPLDEQNVLRFFRRRF